MSEPGSSAAEQEESQVHAQLSLQSQPSQQQHLQFAQASPGSCIRGFVTLSRDAIEGQTHYDSVLEQTMYRLPITRKRKDKQEKTEIMDRVKADWSTNEIAWRQMLQEQEDFTKVRSVRNRLGVYEYFDKETSAPVAAEEYQVRYQSFLLTSKRHHLQAGSDRGGAPQIEITADNVTDIVSLGTSNSSSNSSSNSTDSLYVGGEVGQDELIAVDVDVDAVAQQLPSPPPPSPTLTPPAPAPVPDKENELSPVRPSSQPDQQGLKPLTLTGCPTRAAGLSPSRSAVNNATPEEVGDASDF